MKWIKHFDDAPKRVNHAAVVVGDQIYSFGGYCTGEDYQEFTSMDVHVLDTTTFKWTKHPVSDLPYAENQGVVPYKRYGHTAVAYEGKVYVWGGRNDRASDGTVFCFDTTLNCWTATAVPEPAPLPREAHTACMFKHFMIIFGGVEEETNSLVGTMYALNLEQMIWRPVQTKGKIPGPRDYHSAVFMNNRVYVFGGREDTDLAGQDTHSNDLWFLDMNTQLWIKPDVGGRVPKARRSHSAFAYNNKMYIFGGYDSVEDKHLNDMYKYDPDTHCWSFEIVEGLRPCERRRHASVVVGDRLFLFGGTGPQIRRLPDSDELMDHSDLYILDLKHEYSIA